MPAPASTIEWLDAHFDERVAELTKLARIPSVSAQGFPPEALRRSAEAVAELLRDSGFERADVLELEGAHPYVVGEWLGAGPGAPTLLLYAHHDVQPPGRARHWRTPAFEPTRADDGRLYGRGVVDDKAGVVVFAGALRAWLESGERPPVNLKIVVEGEEEIGSSHLAEFLRSHHERLAADVLVLSDTANLATGLPSLTTSLRGLVNVDVHVKALDHPVHSGMWGGPVPDATSALARILGRLFDAKGEVAIPGFESDVPALSEKARESLAGLPLDMAGFRVDVGLVGSAQLRGATELHAGAAIYERLWHRPSLAIVALEGMPLAEAGNQLIAEAAARVGVRVAPGQDANTMRDRVVAFLESDPPWGVEVRVEAETAVAGWDIDPSGPAFEAAERALRAGYGREPVYIGCGGSIPFVAPFADVLGGVPALLLGLEDPICNAHGENESLDLGDFAKALRAAAHLFSELG